MPNNFKQQVDNLSSQRERNQKITYDLMMGAIHFKTSKNCKVVCITCQLQLLCDKTVVDHNNGKAHKRLFITYIILHYLLLNLKFGVWRYMGVQRGR